LIVREMPYALLHGHVHDEAVCEVRVELAEQVLAEMIRIMGLSPGWAPDLVLAAEGFICKSYKKG